jgi:hypothetical protein
LFLHMAISPDEHIDKQVGLDQNTLSLFYSKYHPHC